MTDYLSAELAKPGAAAALTVGELLLLDTAEGDAVVLDETWESTEAKALEP
jgi:hypothetical protein